MAVFDPSSMEKILEFSILYCGWECDHKGWIVENHDGTRFILLTSHGGEYVGETSELAEKIEEYKKAIDATEQALQLVDEQGGQLPATVAERIGDGLSRRGVW